MSLHKILCFHLIAFLCTACAVGPDYQAPEPKLPATWSELPAKGVSVAPPEVARWWETFNDPVLNSLVDRAVASNLDVRIAEARLREARAARDVAASGLWPSLTTAGSYTRSHAGTSSTASGSSVPSSAGTSAAGRTGSHVDLFRAGFDAAWELDIFGGIRRSVDAADALIGAAQEDYRNVIVSLLAEVALNYAEVCGLQRRMLITEDNLVTQRDTLEITQARYDAGLSSEIDVLRAKAQVAATQSQIPALEDLAKRSMHRLGVLLGTEPGALLSELSERTTIPALPHNVHVDLPSDLLRRRPDIRSAERQLAAATANIGVAVADLFPTFLLSGTFGRQGVDFSDLSLGANKFWSFGSTIQWPLFQGGRIRANIKVQNARQEQALGLYERTVLIALEDLENALVSYSNEQVRNSSLAEAVQSDLQTVTLSRDLYTQGLTDFLTVLDAERSLYADQDQLVQSEQTVVTNLIALYKALGGGWEAYSDPEQRAEQEAE